MCNGTCSLHVVLLAGDDYNEIANETVVFNPGVSTQTVTLTTLPDPQTEDDEDLEAGIAVAADSGISVFAPEAFVTITESSMCLCVCICSDIYTCTYCVYVFILDVIRIMLKASYVDVVENSGLAKVCLMLNRPTSTALNVDVTSVPSGSATGEN